MLSRCPRQASTDIGADILTSDSAQAFLARSNIPVVVLQPPVLRVVQYIPDSRPGGLLQQLLDLPLPVLFGAAGGAALLLLLLCIAGRIFFIWRRRIRSPTKPSITGTSERMPASGESAHRTDHMGRSRLPPRGRLLGSVLPRGTRLPSWAVPPSRCTMSSRVWVVRAQVVRRPPPRCMDSGDQAAQGKASRVGGRAFSQNEAGWSLGSTCSNSLACALRVCAHSAFRCV